MSETHSQQDRPRLSVTEKPNDFRITGETLLQPGCCCCCCCLHWVGAGIGLIIGTTTAYVRDASLPVEEKASRRARLFVAYGVGLGVLIATLLEIVIIVASESFSRLTIATALVPSIVVLPVGFMAIVTGRMVGHVKRDESVLEGNFIQVGEGHEGGNNLGFRVAWMTFALSSVCSGLGYTLMLLFI